MIHSKPRIPGIQNHETPTAMMRPAMAGPQNGSRRFMAEIQ